MKLPFAIRPPQFGSHRLSGYADDGILLSIVVALLSGGIIMIYSASIALHTDVGLNIKGLRTHLIHVVLGFMVLVVTASMRTDWLQNIARVILLLGFVGLGLVLVPGLGVEVNGGLRWIDIGGLRIQPSEAMKLAVVIYFADYFARKQGQVHELQVGVINVGVVVGIIGILLLLEPDFGATTVVILTVSAMMFLAGVRFLHFFASTSIACALMTALVWIEPYRLERVLSHRNPWANADGGGFQLLQSLVAIARGEWFGIGLGNSIQKLGYLPFANNDFLVAIIGEELGMLGILGVLLLYALLLWRAFAIAARALKYKKYFGGFLAQGIGVLLTLQALIHVGVNIGLLPTKGLTLPLMSYGGSNLVCSMAAIGLLLAVDRNTRMRQRG